MSHLHSGVDHERLALAVSDLQKPAEKRDVDMAGGDFKRQVKTADLEIVKSVGWTHVGPAMAETTARLMRKLAEPVVDLLTYPWLAMAAIFSSRSKVSATSARAGS